MKQGPLALFFGLLAVSTSAPFFVMAEVDAYAAVFWRTLLCGLLGLTSSTVRGALSLQVLRDHARSLLIGGVLMGAHFLLWVKAFELTDYASNLLLLVAQPVIATALGFYLGEPVTKRAWLAISMSLVGMLCITGGDVSLGPRALLGDAFCVLAGGLIAVFFAAARQARAALPMDGFMGVTMLVAACVSLPVAWISGVPLAGYSTQSWLWLLGIVGIATVLGHGLMNLAARTVSLFALNLVVVLEPVIAIALGALMFGAEITPAQCAGFVCLASAVWVGLGPQLGEPAPMVQSQPSDAVSQTSELAASQVGHE